MRASSACSSGGRVPRSRARDRSRPRVERCSAQVAATPGLNAAAPDASLSSSGSSCARTSS
eukprot:742851-Alexandrium_andersonii.AAC.1